MRFRFAALALVLLAIAPAHAEKRVALVIGNKDYKSSVGPLTNPLNDIRLVGNALRSVGFEVFKPVQNATRSEMLQAIYALASALKNAGPDAVGFLYYSGHGAASQGENYLIPIDVTEPSTEQLRIQGVKQSEVLAILRDEAPNAAHYLVLDACRNNLQGARGGKGFVPVGQQNGVLVAFSTEPGRTASDTGAGSGPYAAALAAELTKPTEPGENDLNMFHYVRVGVIDRTKGDQVPWFEDGIQRRARPVFANAAQSPSAASSEPAQVWSVVQNTTSIAVLEDYVRQFGATPYGSVARARLEELKGKDLALNQKSAQPLATDREPLVSDWLLGTWCSSMEGDKFVFKATEHGAELSLDYFQPNTKKWSAHKVVVVNDKRAKWVSADSDVNFVRTSQGSVEMKYTSGEGYPMKHCN